MKIIATETMVVKSGDFELEIPEHSHQLKLMYELIMYAPQHVLEGKKLSLIKMTRNTQTMDLRIAKIFVEDAIENIY